MPTIRFLKSFIYEHFPNIKKKRNRFEDKRWTIRMKSKDKFTKLIRSTKILKNKGTCSMTGNWWRFPSMSQAPCYGLLCSTHIGNCALVDVLCTRFVYYCDSYEGILDFTLKHELNFLYFDLLLCNNSIDNVKRVCWTSSKTTSQVRLCTIHVYM